MTLYVDAVVPDEGVTHAPWPMFVPHPCSTRYTLYWQRVEHKCMILETWKDGHHTSANTSAVQRSRWPYLKERAILTHVQGVEEGRQVWDAVNDRQNLRCVYHSLLQVDTIKRNDRCDHAVEYEVLI